MTDDLKCGRQAASKWYLGLIHTNRICTLLISTFALTTLFSAPAIAKGIDGFMSLVEVVSGVIPLIPGSSGSVEAFFHGHSPAPTMDRFGWHHPLIDYQTRDGALLHVQLVSDWQNTNAPDVVRLVVGVDGWQCIDAAKLHDELERSEHIVWASPGLNQGWSASYKGKFLAIGQRQGRCLASVTVDIRRQPRVAHSTLRRLVDPSLHTAAPHTDGVTSENSGS